nr:MAG TPA: hypothetical protein [Caudoviricetes sp.]
MFVNAFHNIFYYFFNFFSFLEKKLQFFKTNDII